MVGEGRFGNSSPLEMLAFGTFLGFGLYLCAEMPSGKIKTEVPGACIDLSYLAEDYPDEFKLKEGKYTPLYRRF